MPRFARLFCLAAFAGWLMIAGSPVCEAQTMLSCGLMNQPAATLLLPYFEVDLENPAGKTTLFSVGNADAEAALAHAVVWTHWGHPVLSFDFFVPAGGVRSFNVRDVLHGRLPKTSPPESLPAERFASCTSPLTLPAVDAEVLTGLLTGRPHPEDGLCYANAAEEGAPVTGYITVDVVHDCSGVELVTPHDTGYFGDCASGLATNDNILWDDFFLVDPAADSAQGEKLVPILADQTRFGSPDECVDPPCSAFRITDSFYRASSNRMPLAAAYEARFLRGGGFEGGTELIVWVKGSVGPVDCDSHVGFGGLSFVRNEFRNEAGEPLGFYILSEVAKSFRVAVGGERLPVAESFGSVKLSAESEVGIVTPPQPESLQLWVMPLVSGAGRYSVGLNTVPVEDFCN